MILKKEYPELFQFFVGYFPDADFEGLSDEEIVLNYISDCNKSEKSMRELEQAKKELNTLIPNVHKHWKEISLESNIYFENIEATEEWLNKIKLELEKYESDNSDLESEID
ncbi:hypothetical protein D1818_10945 [Aquimarina sp. BL5]|uniref:hypothetical protein n=1 Tax=Aquimarina sp. BL5 TaxID=1714860 RepID=UPI000E52BC77|nr:hypothetical protein [Aquimarina sp. BL5]AXT51322.1 hypothetical protein D1818_10945 [Aquimarina sp. BL5]RKN09888.1 hypothetical protein D7036_03705 [Aquimarina sp. BL5]